MPKNIDKPEKLNKSEREELIELRKRTQYLEAELLYLKKLDALINKKSSNKEKTKIILRLRRDQPEVILKIWLDIAKLPRTSFYEWKEKLHRVDQEEIRLLDVIKEIIEESKQTYGYRRVTIALRKKGILVNHERVARIMREHDLRCSKFYRRSRRYNSFKGKIGKIANNMVDRNFTVKEANEV